MAQCVWRHGRAAFAYSRHPAKLTDASEVGGASVWQARSLSDVSEARDWDGKLGGMEWEDRFP